MLYNNDVSVRPPYPENTDDRTLPRDRYGMKIATSMTKDSDRDPIHWPAIDLSCVGWTVAAGGWVVV